MKQINTQGKQVGAPPAKARRSPTETIGTYKSKCTMEKGERRLIRKATWEILGMYPPMQSHKASGG